MNFDYGNLLTRTFQITWKHKVLWGVLALPMVVSFVAFPFMFGYVFLLEGYTNESISLVLDIVVILSIIILNIVGLFLYTAAISGFTLGIVRIEQGEGSLNFLDLLKDGFQYFWRQLGVFLIVQLSIFLVFAVFFACISVLSFVTMGLASFCLQPIFILLTPLMFLSVGVLEAAHTAVVHENLNSLDAIKRGVMIVREHIWKYLIFTLIIYIGISVISSFITFPLMLPIFFFVFSIESNLDLSNYLPIFIGGFACIFFPIMTIFSAISQTLMKTALALAYLNLTKPSNEQVITLPENP